MRNREIVLKEIKKAVSEERQCQLRVLHLLREVDLDGHYLAMGYSSLFDFATQALGYSVGSAWRRIQAMKLLKTAPALESKIEDGSLSLCVAAKTQTFFGNEDRKRKEEGEKKLTPEEKQEIAASMVGASSRECDKKLAEISPDSASPPEGTKPLPKSRTQIRFSASAELMEKLEKLKGLLAHQNRDGSYEGLFEILADIALKKVEPKAPKNDANPSLTPPVEESKPSRYISVEVKRRVWWRDGGCCTFRDALTGRACGSRFAIQFDHIHPFAWGGKATEETLRLRCARHNSYTARRLGLGRPPTSCAA